MPRAKIAPWLLLALALCAPFVLVVAAHHALAERAASAAAHVLLRLTAPLAASTATEAGGAAADPPASFDVGSEVGAAAVSAKAPLRSRRAAALAKPKALFVSADGVLRLTKTAAQPSGSFVAENELHPAGLRLVGVTALGIGVQDGDILIEALGVTPRSSGQIIGAVIEARARRVRYLSGTLWRSGQTLRITVEQPYLDPA